MNWKAYLRWLKSRIVVAESLKDFEILDKLNEYEMTKLCGITPEALKAFTDKLDGAFKFEKANLSGLDIARLNHEDVEIVRAVLLKAVSSVNDEFGRLWLI